MTKPMEYAGSSYLDAAASRLKHVKEMSYARMHVSLGHHILDLGCGAGADTVELAKLVGPTGRVIGVDHDPEMVAKACRRAEEAGVSAWTSHMRADATRLELDANRFDASRSDRVFAHLTHPARAYAELVRVTKPGGWIVAIDPDWSTACIDSDEVGVERRLARFFAERKLINGYAARQHCRRFKEHGLEEVSAEPIPAITLDYATSRYYRLLDQVEPEAVAAGVITEKELQRWRSGLESASKAGTYFASISLYIVAGRKPEEG